MRTFTKLHTYGNDFIIFDNRGNSNQDEIFSSSEVVIMSDRNFGIGCDNLIVVHDSKQINDEKTSFFYADIYNVEGNKIDNSFGAIRCLIGYLSEIVGTPLIKIETMSSIYAGKFNKDLGLVTINAGIPEINNKEVIISGIKHLIEIPEDINNIDATPAADYTKVFVKLHSESSVFIKAIEPEVGEVFSSASAICATTAYCIANGLTAQKIYVETRGSRILAEKIEMTWGGAGKPILQSGKFTKIFTGSIDI
jgi:diaminopimelate epimerase